jgi:formyl-CoA transferase
VVEVDHPERGRFRTVGCPLKLSDSPVEVTRPPLLGEHNDEVFGELGYTAKQLSGLRSIGVI